MGKINIALTFATLLTLTSLFPIKQPKEKNVIIRNGVMILPDGWKREPMTAKDYQLADSLFNLNK